MGACFPSGLESTDIPPQGLASLLPLRHSTARVTRPHSLAKQHLPGHPHKHPPRTPHSHSPVSSSPWCFSSLAVYYLFVLCLSPKGSELQTGSHFICLSPVSSACAEGRCPINTQNKKCMSHLMAQIPRQGDSTYESTPKSTAYNMNSSLCKY